MRPRAWPLYVDDGATAVPDAVHLLDGAGIRPGAITLSRPSLDDVFLASTGRRIEGGAMEVDR